ncbi:hypothetical protein FA13DRAFT_1803061 [Coprinellus micaceus]|uniref:Uncharacterized protein n=1 Tax=Coprinellus micaceus TaxID=71717 RepID=A0A4Y7SBK7_COPMI|nr:hypothetical protein FA13DRAFT_1803061 [Coprinellus micaceus]
MDAFTANTALWLAHFSPEVVEQIVEWLPVWVLKILTHSPTYASMARRVLNNRVVGFLQLWGLHPDETLTLMRRHHAILSGQAALTTVEPAPWFPDDLDFYCPITTCDEVVDWFVCHGYVVEDDRAPVIDLEFGNGIARADLESPDEMTALAFDFPIVRTGISKGICRSVSLRQPASGKHIRVNESYSDNAAVPVCFFPSTLDMNFITGNGVVSLYPQLTSKRRGLLNMQLNPPLFPVERETIASLTKYQERGYSFFHGKEMLPGAVETNSALDELVVRTWDDNLAVQMDFDHRHPATLLPALHWSLAKRDYDDTGFTDFLPFVFVSNELRSIMYEDGNRFYQSIRMAPEAL